MWFVTHGYGAASQAGGTRLNGVIGPPPRWLSLLFKFGAVVPFSPDAA